MMGETETMLKIFLAEDEIVMREGIRNNIAWQEEGFEFVGEASDGELAYPMIQKLKPDILSRTSGCLLWMDWNLAGS